MRKLLILGIVTIGLTAGCLSETTGPTIFDSPQEFAQNYTQHEDDIVQVRQAWIGTAVKKLDDTTYLLTIYDRDSNPLSTERFESGGLNVMVGKKIGEALIGHFLGQKDSSGMIYKVNLAGKLSKTSNGTWGFWVHIVQILNENNETNEEFVSEEMATQGD